MAGAEVVYSYASPEMIFLWFFLGLTLLIVVVAAISRRRSREYRQTLSDMYVSGKIRQLAKEDNINLEDEFKEFVRSNKSRRIQETGLDRTIEEDLQEKIAIKVADKLNKGDKAK